MTEQKLPPFHPLVAHLGPAGMLLRFDLLQELSAGDLGHNWRVVGLIVWRRTREPLGQFLKNTPRTEIARELF